MREESGDRGVGSSGEAKAKATPTTDHTETSRINTDSNGEASSARTQYFASPICVIRARHRVKRKQKQHPPPDHTETSRINTDLNGEASSARTQYFAFPDLCNPCPKGPCNPWWVLLLLCTSTDSRRCFRGGNSVH